MSPEERRPVTRPPDVEPCVPDPHDVLPRQAMPGIAADRREHYVADDTMRAVTYHRYGQPEVLRVDDVPDPTPAEDEVLIRVEAAGVNPWDWDRLTGTPIYTRLEGLRTPSVTILGADIAGTVVATGQDVVTFSVGDDVFGDISHDGWGGFAEYVAVKPDRLARKPEAMSWDVAAALPQAGVLALQGLDWRRPLEEGQRVLINGAGGGVGTLGVQIARQRGCHVTAVDASHKLQALADLGADAVIDYRSADFTRIGDRFDVVVDVISRRPARAFTRCLTDNGKAAVVGGTARALLSAAVLGWLHTAASDRDIGVVVHRPNREDTEKLARSVLVGTLHPLIDEVYPLEDVPRALTDIGAHRITGKAVIRIGS